MTRLEIVNAHRRAPRVEVLIDDQEFILVPKLFSTGSLGWHGQGKIFIQGTKVQATVSLTVINSKEVDDKAGTPGQHIRYGVKVGEPEQNGTAPKNVPETPPSVSELFPADSGKKRRLK